MTTAKRALARLDLEVMIPGQAGQLRFTALGAVSGPWTWHGGRTGSLTLPGAVDGDDLVVTWTGAEATAVIGKPWALRQDGHDRVAGDVRRAKPGAAGTGNEISVTLADETVLNVTVVAAIEPEVFVGPSQPLEPVDPDRAVWHRTPGDLRSFVDFRLMPDGPLPAHTNGTGPEDPAGLLSFHAFPAPFAPAKIINGALQSDTVTPTSAEDPTPRVGFAVLIEPGATGRVGWGHGGYAKANNEDLYTSITSNIAVSDFAGNAYLFDVLVGRFDPETGDIVPENEPSAGLRLIRDDLTAPSQIAWAPIADPPVDEDGAIDFSGWWFEFGWAPGGVLAGYVNGVEAITATDDTYDISTFNTVAMPLHQGSPAEGHEWEDAYYTRVEWFGVSAGDPITGELGPHRWTGDGWQPIGPGARPALNGSLTERLVAGLTNSDGGPVTGLEGTIRVTDNGVFELPTLTEADHGRPLTFLVASNGATIDTVVVPGTGTVADYELTNRTAVQLRWYGYGDGYWFVASVAGITPGGGGLDEAAVQALIDTAVANLVDGAPGALDTLNELAAALADDASFAASVAAALAGKVDTSDARLSDARTPTDGSVTAAKLAAAIAGRLPATARATSSDTRSTTGSGAIDSELKFTGAANTFYRVDMHVQLSGDPTIDAKVGIAAPAGSTCSVIVDYYATNIAANTGAEQRGHITDLDSTGAINVGVIASPGLAVSIIGWVVTGGTAGDVGLWWRPANTGALTRHAGSYLDYRNP